MIYWCNINKVPSEIIYCMASSHLDGPFRSILDGCWRKYVQVFSAGIPEKPTSVFLGQRYHKTKKYNRKSIGSHVMSWKLSSMSHRLIEHWMDQS